MRPKTSSEIQEAIVLRLAGYTIPSIVVRTGISVSTLTRHFKAHGVSRGSISKESIDEARERLLNDSGFIDQLKHEIAAQVLDDLALATLVRRDLVHTLEQLQDEAPAIRSRALAAISTSIKVTSDTMRRALRMDDSATLNQSSLPELTIREMTAAEIMALSGAHDECEMT